MSVWIVFDLNGTLLCESRSRRSSKKNAEKVRPGVARLFDLVVRHVPAARLLLTWLFGLRRLFLSFQDCVWIALWQTHFV